MSLPGFLASEFPPVAPKKAAFHVIPVPYEHTVSYGGGTALGPEAILQASQKLEAIVDGSGLQPGAFGIHTTGPVDTSGEVETVMHRVHAAITGALEAGAVPAMLGGEHTVTFGAVLALAEHLDGKFGVVQIDAHADLRDSDHDTPWSHTCIMRRVLDMGLPIAQFGVRSLSALELDVRQQERIWHLDAERLLLEGVPEQLLPAGFPKNIYVTFDIDAFDASLMPATGKPEPGGLFWWPAVRLLRRIAAGRRIVGFDVVELAPIKGLHHADFTAAKLVYTLMGLACPQ